MWQTLLNILLTPEVAVTLASLLVALLLKSKLLTESDFNRAKDLIQAGHDLTHVTDKTRLKIEEVKKVAAELQGPDTNKKKIQRVARKLLRGWLKF